MRKIWDSLHPALTVVVIGILLVATWLVSYQFTLQTLSPYYDSDRGLIFTEDYLGNVNWYTAEDIGGNRK